MASKKKKSKDECIQTALEEFASTSFGTKQATEIVAKNREEQIALATARFNNMSAAEILVDLDEMRKEAKEQGKTKQVIDCSKILLEYLVVPMDTSAKSPRPATSEGVLAKIKAKASISSDSE